MCSQPIVVSALAKAASRSSLWLLGLLWLAGCTDPYLPEVTKSPPNYLVVDGFLNAQGVTTIKLSRTTAIAATTAPVETRATAYIEDESGSRLPLTEGSVKGTYTSAALTLNTSRKYRLHLNTQAGKEYASEFVPVKLTPPVDGISWRFNNSGFNVYVSAHDATNNTRYYGWDFDETWEIRPTYSSQFEYVNHTMRYRLVPLPIVCWGTDISKTIQIDKTTALSQDVVAEHQLRTLAANTERLFTRYSIRVQQYAFTPEEYAYWELLRKNTESIGSLFDPQPAQVTGNVHCLSTPAEVTLGYVGAHSVTEKRLFVAYSDLPRNMNFLTGYERCYPLDTIDLYPKIPGPPTPAQIMEAAFSNPNYVPVTDIKDNSGKPIAYMAKDLDCVDCRTRGTAAKPSYWP